MAIPSELNLLDLSDSTNYLSRASSSFLYKTIADYTYDWEYLLNPDQRLTYMSPSCRRITGYPVASFLTDEDLLQKVVYPRDKSRFANHLEKKLPERKVCSIEFRIIDHSGRLHWIGQKTQPVFLDNGDFFGWRISNRDITDIKLSQKKTQESLRKLSLFIANADSGIILVDARGLICEWNPSQEKMTGFLKSSMIRKPFWEFRKNLNYSPTDQSGLDEISEDSVLEVLSSGKGKLVNNTFVWMLKKPGEPDRYIQEHYFTFYTSQGRQLGCITRDITDIKLSAMELERICENRTGQLQKEILIREQAEVELTRHLEIEHSLSKISRIFIQNVNLKETIPLVMQRLAMVTKADRVSLYVANKIENKIETIFTWISSSGTSRRIHPPEITIEDQFPFCTDELLAGHIFNEKSERFSIENDPLKNDGLSEGIFQSMILVPVITIHDFLGVIRLDFNEENSSGLQRSDRFLEITSQIIGGALERDKIMDALEHQVRDRTQDIKILYRIASLVSKPTDVEGILKSSLDILMELPVNIGAGFIHYQSNDDQENALVNYKNIPEDSVQSITEMFNSDFIRNELIKSMEPIIIPDLRKQADIPVEICLGRYFSYIGIPIWVKGRLLGILSLLGENFDHLTLENITLLTAIGDQIGGAIEGEYLRARAKEAAIIEERQRLARELHDSVTQYLYSLNLLIKGWRREVGTARPEEIDQWLTSAAEITSLSLKEMRLLLYTLHPQTMLNREGLIGSVERYLQKMEKQAGLKTEFFVDQNIELPPGAEYELFRIVQESLTNVIKHSDASKLSVSIKNARDYVELQINDNGRGFDPASLFENKGMGITLMRERADNIKSTFMINSKPGEGTRVTVRVKTNQFEQPSSIPMVKETVA